MSRRRLTPYAVTLQCAVDRLLIEKNPCGHPTAAGGRQVEVQFDGGFLQDALIVEEDVEKEVAAAMDRGS